MTTEHDRGRSILLATDGACLGNPGPGGWGVVVHELEGDTVISRHALAGRADGDTTNNQMELTAAFEALRFIGGKSSPLTIITDSKYVVDGMTQWMDSWKSNGWRTAGRKPVKNLELWMALDDLTRGRAVHWQWTRGHAGHTLNEAADMLANNAARGVYGDPVGSLADFHPELFEQEMIT